MLQRKNILAGTDLPRLNGRFYCGTRNRLTARFAILRGVHLWLEKGEKLVKKFALAVGAIVATLAVAPAVSAAPFISVLTGSGSFGNGNVSCIVGAATPCTFSDTFTFVTPTGFNLTSATISSSTAGMDPATNIDFTSVVLNNVDFSTVLTGVTEFRQLLNQALVANATNTLTVSGTTGGNGSYGGSLVFANAAPVPEPAAWALMILGFGVAGYALRRRPGVRFVQAN